MPTGKQYHIKTQNRTKNIAVVKARPMHPEIRTKSLLLTAELPANHGVILEILAIMSFIIVPCQKWHLLLSTHKCLIDYQCMVWKSWFHAFLLICRIWSMCWDNGIYVFVTNFKINMRSKLFWYIFYVNLWKVYFIYAYELHQRNMQSSLLHGVRCYNRNTRSTCRTFCQWTILGKTPLHSREKQLPQEEIIMVWEDLHNLICNYDWPWL